MHQSDPIRATIAQADEALDRLNVGDSTDPNAPHYQAAIGYLRSAVLQLADRDPVATRPSPCILQLVFTSGALTVRGVTRIRYVDGLLSYGRPYDFDGHGIIADPGQIKSVQLLSEEDLHEMDLNLPGDGDQNWRATKAGA